MEGFYERIRDDNAIVRVTAKKGEQATAATGFFYGKHDFIITAGHVAAFASPSNNISIRFRHADEEFACTTVFVSSNFLDFAVLRVANPRNHGFMFCSSHLRPAMNVYAVGFQDNDLKMSKGTVTLKGFTFSTDARADNCFSGGVILNASFYEALGVIKDCTGELANVTNFTPCLSIYDQIINYNNSQDTVKIPNINEYNWPDSN